MASPNSVKADQRLALAALEKTKRGDTPTREESAALKRIENIRETESRTKHFAAIRKGEWSEWSGRQIKTINEQAERYSAPLLGATIDLPAFVRWFHDFLARNASAIARANPAGGDDESGDDPETIRWRRARANREELRYLRELEEFVDVDKIRDGLAVFASVLRGAGERLQRDCGEVAYKIFDEAIEEAIRVFNSHFGDGDDSLDAEGDAADEPV